MRSRALLALILAVLLAATLARAAVIHGTVYSIELNMVRNALVEINSQPKQVVVTANGTYAFDVPAGSYVLFAKQIQNGEVVAQTAERLTVPAEGDFVLDLILFPDLDNESDILNGTNEINPDEANLERTTSLAYIILWLALCVVLSWFIMRKRKPDAAAKAAGAAPPAQGDLDEVVGFIRDQGGRTTQKDIRKHSHLSEAKISLILAELEHKGLVQKIKKGRGNIVILK